MPVDARIPLAIDNTGYDPDAYQKGFTLGREQVNAPIETEAKRTKLATDKQALAEAQLNALAGILPNVKDERSYHAAGDLATKMGIDTTDFFKQYPNYGDGSHVAALNNTLQAQKAQTAQATAQSEIGLKNAQATYYQNGGKQPAAAMLAHDMEQARLNNDPTRYNELAAAAKLLDKGQMYSFPNNSQAATDTQVAPPNPNGAPNPNINPQAAINAPAGQPNTAPNMAAPGNAPTIVNQPGYNNAVAGKTTAKKQAELNVKTGGEANAAEETFGKLNQNLDAMETLVKSGKTPASKYFVPASVQASIGRNIPQLGMGDTAKGYTDFNTLNTPVVLNTLRELTSGGAIRGNQTIEKMINQGFMIDPDLSDQEKLDKIATIRAELKNAAISSRNISNKDKGQPSQPYQGMPTASGLLQTSSENASAGTPNGNLIQQATGRPPLANQSKAAIASRLNPKDPRVKAALAAGYSADEIASHLMGGR